MAIDRLEAQSKAPEEMVQLLRFLVALELWKSGVSQADIGKRLGIAAGSVNKLVKGVKRPAA